jgi:hypothetical protein
MYVYYSLRKLAQTFGWLRREFFDWGNTIRNVWLIGQHLAVWIFSVSDFFGDIEDVVYEVSDDWKELYNWLIHNLGTSNIPADLLRYADDLISFIKYPFDWIGDTIRDMFPGLYEVAKDPISWVLETIYRYTGFSVDFVDDPVRFIRNLIREMVGDVLDIARDPYGWIVSQLDNIIPDFWRFIYDARGWVREKIEDEFPFLMSFLNDPDGFIEDKLINFLDDIADRYRERAVKLFEKVLQIIF